VSRPAKIHQFSWVGVLALPCIAAAWWGCAEGSGEETDPDGTGGSTLSLSASSGGSVGTGGIGVGGGAGGSEVCVTTSEKAEPVPLDLIFVMDRSGSMATDGKWTATKSALSVFFNDPTSAGIGVGLVFFPTLKPFLSQCDVVAYKILDVPVGQLPDNAFNLTNAMPQDAASFVGSPTIEALTGALMVATARQDAYPDHKVNVVLLTDGDPSVCENGVVVPVEGPATQETIDDAADVAKSAVDYNGVRTYIIAVEGSYVDNVDQIAAAGGTTAAYDITKDIDLFSAAMAEIRSSALACEFAIPPPPNDTELVPDEVNFTYTPGGTNTPVTLPRANDLADCGDEPGWYYDSNGAPTKILLCPASCGTVQNDSSAEVAVAFGCQSILN
jgi:hypothetical protein